MKKQRKHILPIGTVVSFLIDRSGNDGLTPLQINKLVYICHGWTLGHIGRPLIKNDFDQIQAWKYGPVVVDVYHDLKVFDRKEVILDDYIIEKHKELENKPEYNQDYLEVEFEIMIEATLDRLKNKMPNLTNLLNWVYERYEDYTPEDLIDITHQPDTPWDQCRKRSPGLKTFYHIPDDVIKGYYKGLLGY